MLAGSLAKMARLIPAFVAGPVNVVAFLSLQQNLA
jgi:hypothetical protein